MSRSQDAPLPAPRPYHHGDLKLALLAAAERILETDGIQALTLRAAARAAGVTHAAPANHFGDLTGLLSELAAMGHRRLATVLDAAIDKAGREPRTRTRAMGRAYMAFAQQHPGLFTLMMRSERLDAERPVLKDAIIASRQALRNIVSERRPGKQRSPLDIAAQGVALWSFVHGYAVLMHEGRLKGILASLPDDVSTEAFFEAVLGALTLK